MGLTTLALRHGWHCHPISDPCARDSFRSPVAKYDVRNLELIEDGLYKVEVRNHREEIFANFFVH
jgi:hypothetical protein